MTFDTAYALAQDAAFHRRLQIALVKAAAAVFNESQGTANHNDRARFATAVMTNPTGYAERHAAAIVADETITGASSDSAIENQVSALWNAFSGAGLSTGAGPPSVFLVDMVPNALTFTDAPSGGLEILTTGGSRIRADLRNASRVVGQVVFSVAPAAAGVARFEYSINDGGAWSTLLDMLTGSYTANTLKASSPGVVADAAKVSTCLLRVVVTGDGVVDAVLQKAVLSFQAP